MSILQILLFHMFKCSLALLISSTAGLGLLLVLLQVLYCTKPGCRRSHLQELNTPEIIKIKSFNEIEKNLISSKDVNVPETISERIHNLNEEPVSVPMNGSLKNLKSADIILNSSKLVLE